MKRRDFLTFSIKSAMAAGLTSTMPLALLRSQNVHAAIIGVALSDPTVQSLFTNSVPNAMSREFKYIPYKNSLTIFTEQSVQKTGLVGINGNPLSTTIWGYGARANSGSTAGQVNVTWPGFTIERHINDAPLKILWLNNLTDHSHLTNDPSSDTDTLPVPASPLPHLLPVDITLHWAYSLFGQNSANGVDYRQYSIAKDGVPLVPHVHGGKNDSTYDGNPEYFFSPNNGVTGPRYVTNQCEYGGPQWNNTAGMMWYHDHALGLTRLNVYAGLAGFFVLRDYNDTGKVGNPAGFPADPYELGYAVQDRMFRDTGELFFPSSLTGSYTSAAFNPSVLPEFFGDHMVVNGIIWPKVSVERRQYRMRFLNGCDSRFMRLKFKVITGGASNLNATNPDNGYELPFYVVGSDQSLRFTEVQVLEANFIPSERLDLVVDFKDVKQGDRVIVENILGDTPFQGGLRDISNTFPNSRTNRIMAFDVELPVNYNVPDTYIGSRYQQGGLNTTAPTDPGSVVTQSNLNIKIRKLALFEGIDDLMRLQPLLGVAEPSLDMEGNLVDGTLAWHHNITENPTIGDTEIWEIYNATIDAHPIHVHLVHFQVLSRQDFTANLINQPIQQANGKVGVGRRLENINIVGQSRPADVIEQTRRDVVMALPGEVTRIQMTFNKSGRFVWHCHILSHEDHEMMRPFYVSEV